MNKEELLDYLIDKFNVTLQFERGQLEKMLETFSNRIVSWELYTSIISLIALVLVLIIITVIAKKIDKKHNILKYVKDNFSNYSLNQEDSTRFFRGIVVIALFSFVLLICILNSAFEIFDIVQCIIFPEKVVIEFIGKYI